MRIEDLLSRISDNLALSFVDHGAFVNKADLYSIRVVVDSTLARVYEELQQEEANADR